MPLQVACGRHFLQLSGQQNVLLTEFRLSTHIPVFAYGHALRLHAQRRAVGRRGRARTRRRSILLTSCWARVRVSMVVAIAQDLLATLSKGAFRYGCFRAFASFHSVGRPSSSGHHHLLSPPSITTLTMLHHPHDHPYDLSITGGGGNAQGKMWGVGGGSFLCCL